MLLLELADDDHDFLWAFGMWATVVACLIMWSKYLQRREAMAIDPAAAGGVNQLRERIQRQRPESHAPGASASSAAPSSSSSNGSSAAAASSAASSGAPGGPRAREDCPICLDTVSWPVDTNCSHTFCCSCFLSYHAQAAGVLRHMVKCPCCRRGCDMILPTEPGWTEAERNSETGRKLAADLADYNRRYSSEPRSWSDAARDTPHLLRRFWTELTSGGADSVRLFSQARLWILILSGFFYLISPLDFMPEAFFGLFGLIDDFIVLVVLGIMVAGVFRNVMLQRAAQAA